MFENIALISWKIIPNSAESTTVLILGGGIAGVTAANTLQAAGISDFILLEGSKGVGGRARGANWIHGVEKNANPLVPIAKAANLQLFYTANTSTLSARDSNGRCVHSTYLL